MAPTTTTATAVSATAVPVPVPALYGHLRLLQLLRLLQSAFGQDTRYKIQDTSTCGAGAWANNEHETLAGVFLALFPWPNVARVTHGVRHSSLIKFTEAKQLCLGAHLFPSAYLCVSHGYG